MFFAVISVVRLSATDCGSCKAEAWVAACDKCDCVVVVVVVLTFSTVSQSTKSHYQHDSYCCLVAAAPSAA